MRIRKVWAPAAVLALALAVLWFLFEDAERIATPGQDALAPTDPAVSLPVLRTVELEAPESREAAIEGRAVDEEEEPILDEYEMFDHNEELSDREMPAGARNMLANSPFDDEALEEELRARILERTNELFEEKFLAGDHRTVIAPPGEKIDVGGSPPGPPNGYQIRTTTLPSGMNETRIAVVDPCEHPDLLDLHARLERVRAQRKAAAAASVGE